MIIDTQIIGKLEDELLKSSNAIERVNLSINISILKQAERVWIELHPERYKK